MEAEGRLSWRVYGQKAQEWPWVSPYLAEGSLVTLKLYQDQIKKPCQYSGCARKEEKWVRKLFLYSITDRNHKVKLTLGYTSHCLSGFYHIMANTISSEKVVVLLWIFFGVVLFFIFLEQHLCLGGCRTLGCETEMKLGLILMRTQRCCFKRTGSSCKTWGMSFVQQLWGRRTETAKMSVVIQCLKISVS